MVRALNLRTIEEPHSALRGIFARKVFCLFFDSLAYPAAPMSGIFASLRPATANALAVAVQAGKDGMFPSRK
jgi:hypothetical protein